jgi:hypothetical protein
MNVPPGKTQLRSGASVYFPAVLVDSEPFEGRFQRFQSLPLTHLLQFVRSRNEHSCPTMSTQEIRVGTIRTHRRVKGHKALTIL